MKTAIAQNPLYVVSSWVHSVQSYPARLTYGNQYSHARRNNRDRSPLPPPPPCTQCASSATEPVVTMRRHTVDADPWYLLRGMRTRLHTPPRFDA